MTIAHIYEANNTEVYDYAFNRETAITYIQAGYTAKAVVSDGFNSIEELQEAFDYERALYVDCFGL